MMATFGSGASSAMAVASVVGGRLRAGATVEPCRDLRQRACSYVIPGSHGLPNAAQWMSFGSATSSITGIAFHAGSSRRRLGPR